MKRLVRLAFIAVALALAGCGSTSSTKVFHSAFDDITQETRSTVGDFSTYRQLITLNGLMPMHVPGMLFYEPTASWLPSWRQKESPALLVGISPKRSMVVEVRYDAEDPGKTVAAVQQAYQTLRTKAVAAVAARLRVALFEALSQAKDEDQIRMLSRTLGFTQEKPADKDVTAMKKKAMEESENARSELVTAQATFSSGLKDNIMVARWTKKEDFEGVAKIFDLVGLSSGRQSEETGVLILGGIRVLNTFFGEDLFCMARNSRPNSAQWKNMKRVSITANMIQARAVGYVSDLDIAQTLALSLDISKEQLTQLLKDGLLEAAGAGAKIKAEALVASAMGVSNFGRMTNPAVDVRKTRFYPGARQIEELEEELEGRHSGKYVTVNVTRVQFTDEMLETLAAAASDTICNEELEPQQSLMEAAARTLRRIEISASAASNAIGHGKEELPQADLLRRALKEKLASTATAFESCRNRIAEIDRGVMDALAAEMNASEQEREARRFRVRIRQLERDQDGAEIMAFLNGVNNELYDAHNGLRGAQTLLLDGKDPRPEVKRVALALGVKTDAKLTEVGALGVPSGGDRKGEAALLEVKETPAGLEKEALAIQPRPAPEPRLVQICHTTRPSRL